MHKQNWIIRKANESDAKALTECMYHSYKTYTERLDGKLLPPMTVNYLEEIRHYPVWVAESNSLIIGGLILMPEEECMTIANVAVDPSFQGQGLGTGFLIFAEEKAKKEGYGQICLATHVLLTENIALYSYLGWEEIQRDTSKVYMRKNLI